MSANENVKTPCLKCNGKGYLNQNIKYRNGIYKIICPKCVGARKLDWIQQISGILDYDAISIILTIVNFEKDNYIFVHSGCTYFIGRKYFLNPDQWRYISMSASYAKKNPEFLKMWRI